MNIHHTHKKQAEKIGTILEEHGAFIKATWPMRNTVIFSQDARYAVQQMTAAQKIIRQGEERGVEVKVVPSLAQPTMVHLVFDGDQTTETRTPVMWLQDENLWEDKINSKEQEPNEEVQVESRTSEEDGEEAPQDADAEEGAKRGASVVKQEYRARYAEAGHPSHCGDELAIKLNNLVGGKAVNLEYFKMILDANGVDMTKYRTEGNGWQGRWRMTGRIKLARTIFSNGGELKMPNEAPSYFMSADWMASQRFTK